MVNNLFIALTIIVIEEMLKVGVLLLLPMATICCMDRNCDNCHSVFEKGLLTEICSKCKINFYVGQHGHCQVNLTKILVVITVGLLVICSSFLLRYLVYRFVTRTPSKLTPQFYAHMEQIAKQRPVTVLDRPYVPSTERRLNGEKTQEKICGICQKSINFRDKRVDVYSKCEHCFHSICLQQHLLKTTAEKSFYNLPCPTCKQVLHLISIYCQDCHQRHRDFEMNTLIAVRKLRFYTCFLCKNRQKREKKEYLHSKWGVAGKCCVCCI